MAYNLYESYTGPDDGGVAYYGESQMTAQTFTPSINHVVYTVKVKLYRNGGSSNPGTLTVSIKATSAGKPTGVNLASGTTNGNTLPTSYATAEWREITFSTPVELTASTVYAICVYGPSSNATNQWGICKDGSSPSYSGGQRATCSDWNDTTHTGTWTLVSSDDYVFYEYGLAAVEPPATDAYTVKRLVCCATKEVWVEASAGGTMEQLSGSQNTLDTTDYLDMFELFGKAFIVNRSIKKVVDLINIKLTTTNIGSNPPDFGTVLEVIASGAQMSVDYITSLTGACIIYGKRLTSTTFASGDTVQGTDDDGNAISFVISADEDGGPHYYNWTSYGNSSNYGSLPDNITIGCNYRGRAVVAGDPLYPHQWYMSRQGNPWNWLYGINDAQSAVAGNDTDAGEIGDIIRALIPISDDYLIVGGDNSIWYLIGDPCDGGSIEPFDLTTGIYGPKAWCFDGSGNLYFFGRNGLYKTGVPGKPVCISEIKLPNLIADESPDQSTHRIILTFDAIRKGIIISITKLSDGANSNYWYDLRALDDNEIGGFFPEEYPEECAIFSSFFYESKNPDYRKLILGCNDGYLRFFDPTSKNDNIGATTEAINSYIDFGPIPMADDPKFMGKLTGLFAELAGGASGGTESDSDSLYYRIFSAPSAAEVIEKLTANTSPVVIGTLYAPGRQHGKMLRKKVKNVYMGLKIGNDTASESWAFEQIVYDLKKSGKFK